jgi:hypothetical protein
MKKSGSPKVIRLLVTGDAPLLHRSSVREKVEPVRFRVAFPVFEGPPELIFDSIGVHKDVLLGPQPVVAEVESGRLRGGGLFIRNRKSSSAREGGVVP